MTANLEPHAKYALAGLLALSILGAARRSEAVVDPAKLCRSAKLTAAAIHGSCRLRVASRFANSAQSATDSARRDADASKCDLALSAAYAKAEARYRPSCPSIGDSADVIDYLADRADRLAKNLPYPNPVIPEDATRSFVDNGDGTVTDKLTGLVWEKKSDDRSVHDCDRFGTWGIAPFQALLMGTIADQFLAELNTPPCFAGHCDWRIPNVNELLSIVKRDRGSAPYTFPIFDQGCTFGCSVFECNCACGELWTSTTAISSSYFDIARVVDFDAIASAGAPDDDEKTYFHAVRAVRGGR